MPVPLLGTIIKTAAELKNIENYDEDLLKLYRDLGGKILTLGSDAHQPADLGGGIAQGQELARSCGFDQICYFLHHEPHFIKL